MRNFSFDNLVLTNRGHQLDNIADNMFNPKKGYYIVGKTKDILAFLKRTGNEMSHDSIIGIIVTEENEKMREYFGYPVVSDNDMMAGDNVSIICTSRDMHEYDIIKSHFEGLGFKQNINFFQSEIFSMMYDVYQKDTIKIDRIEVFATAYCTLKCKKCIAFNPYFKTRSHVSIDVLKADADLLFSKVDYIYKLKILGGDAFCYPNLVEYMDYLGKYRDKIGTIRVGTNGTILPTKEVIDSCIRNRCILDISDYSRNASSICKIDEIKEICENVGLQYDIKRTDEQWLDVGFPDNIPKQKSEEQLKQQYVKCGMFCRDFLNGKLYFCCGNFAAVKGELFPDNENDYFDFNKEFTKQELLEFELGFNSLGHTTFCNVCRGCSDEINPFHIEVAKQID